MTDRIKFMAGDENYRLPSGIACSVKYMPNGIKCPVDDEILSRMTCLVGDEMLGEITYQVDNEMGGEIRFSMG